MPADGADVSGSVRRALEPGPELAGVELVVVDEFLVANRIESGTISILSACTRFWGRSHELSVTTLTATCSSPGVPRPRPLGVWIPHGVMEISSRCVGRNASRSSESSRTRISHRPG